MLKINGFLNRHHSAFAASLLCPLLIFHAVPHKLICCMPLLQFLQGVFSALGGGGMAGGPGGVGPGGAVPSLAGQHLLQSIGGLLQRLEQPTTQLPPMPVYSLDMRGGRGEGQGAGCNGPVVLFCC
jgi:hypothetical protein